MEFINPGDIEDISILKDAAAAAIYGARAANGVVLIKTNHGKKSEKIQVKVNLRTGIDTPSKKLNFINGQQYTDYLNQRFANDGIATVVNWNGVDTDWQKENISSAIVQDYGFSIAGGGENSTHFVSANYFNQDGILVESGFERINFRFNNKFDMGRFHVTQSLGITQGQLQENRWYGFDGTTAPTVAFSNPNNDGGFEAPSTDVQGPGDSTMNRVRIADIKMLCGDTAVHSDMFTYNKEEPLEIKALQLVNTLFGVPQLSILLQQATEDELSMIHFYTHYWRNHSSVFLNGKFVPHKPLANYPVLTSYSEEHTIIGLFDNYVLDFEEKTDTIDIINGQLVSKLVLSSTTNYGAYHCIIYDCTGKKIKECSLMILIGVVQIKVPPCGLIKLKKNIGT